MLQLQWLACLLAMADCAALSAPTFVQPQQRLTQRCPADARMVACDIAITGINSRQISASIVIARPVREVWAILTDYDNLSQYVPNLVVSRREPAPNGKIRVFQEGAQNLAGFDFRASLTMEMVEKLPQHRLEFSCYRSFMFDKFSGKWQLSALPGDRTGLSYTVTVTPKGPVPVVAIEWRIREDVPLNLQAIKLEAESRPRSR